jgi:flavin reductase (DIM6/NTAB) family NADH-FMN oxidoreductase RutF
MNLTPAPAKIVKAPIIEESPVNIECVVKDIVELGTHHMFISDVVGVSVDNKYMNEQQAFSFSKADPLVYSHGHYFGLGKIVGKFGWSVEKKKKAKK